MKKIAGLVAIALRLHREGYNFRHGVFEELADRERISYNDALTVTEPLAELIDLEILDGGDGSELQNIDARLIDINRADQGFMNDPAFFWRLGPVDIVREHNIAGLFRRR